MNSNDLIIYRDKDKKIEVSLREETIWLSLKQIAELFDVQKATMFRIWATYVLKNYLVKSYAINKNALIALCYLVAGSRPDQKEILSILITQMISDEGVNLNE